MPRNIQSWKKLENGINSKDGKYGRSENAQEFNYQGIKQTNDTIKKKKKTMKQIKIERERGE